MTEIKPETLDTNRKPLPFPAYATALVAELVAGWLVLEARQRLTIST